MSMHETRDKGRIELPRDLPYGQGEVEFRELYLAMHSSVAYAMAPVRMQKGPIDESFEVTVTVHPETGNFVRWLKSHNRGQRNANGGWLIGSYRGDRGACNIYAAAMSDILIVGCESVETRLTMLD